MADVLWRLIWIALGLIFLTKCCPADGVEVGLAMDSQKQEMPTDRSGLSLWTLAYAVDFVHAFVASISVIIVSELGDKTFFIAALMAMRHSRLVVFSGAIAALFIMTVLSVVLGFATTVIPRTYTYYASTVLFAVFGIKMMKEAWGMSPDEGQEELEQVSAELKKKDEQLHNEQFQSLPNGDIESGIQPIKVFHRRASRWFRCISPIFLQASTLTFLAEWGDRSQLATIILASREVGKLSQDLLWV
jgi:putative Ca2+/H+ antiporter (TMEM165/GDT1 family)